MEAGAAPGDDSYYADCTDMETSGSADHLDVDDLLAVPYSEDDGVGSEEATAGADTGDASLPLQPVDAHRGATGLLKDGFGWGDFSGDSSTTMALDSSSNSFLLDAGDLLGAFREPDDQLAELEWLLGEDVESFDDEALEKSKLISGGFSARFPPPRVAPAAADSTAVTQLDQTSFFLPDAPVLSKARSKRSRAAPVNWSSRLPVFLTTPPTSPAQPGPSARRKMLKKKNAPASTEGRRCLHCEAVNTPQWRTGPMGRKTLCNACGVKYKAGRLMPEYRPAASPTFLSSEHSNCHRKVLEMCRQKELMQQPQPDGITADDGPDGWPMRRQSAVLFDGPPSSSDGNTPGRDAADDVLAAEQPGTNHPQLS